MSVIMRSKLLIKALLLVWLGACQQKEAKVYEESDIQIIPKPENLTINPGVFQFEKNTQIVVTAEDQKPAAQLLVDKFKKSTGWELPITHEESGSGHVLFRKDDSLEEEAYRLKVDEDQITISASGTSGFLYGAQTLRQLLPVAIESSAPVENVMWEVPNVEVSDAPRFKWRGLMLDLSRHFFGKEYILKTIDHLSFHKMNILHLHLVDDQGWRIEIKKYPKLTEVGAWRVDQEHLPWDERKTNDPDEKGTYGGFLTQEELKEIVAYAATKGVEVIPEIEMPAHVSSAIAAYPELSCHGEPIAVPSGSLWPITDIYCVGKESTFEFLENVLLEVMDIFPSQYIHIGGDEATKTTWEVDQLSLKRMETEGLESVEELQSYFIKRIEKFINSKGKKLIGWDEILEGGLASGATVMSWRSFQGGVKAAQQGNDAIMTPVWFCYFDYYQGPPELEPKAAGPVTTVSKVYSFEPIVDDLTEDEEKHILGSQANVWAEHIPTEEHSQYMIFPRLTALSEVLWSPKESRDWDDFSRRLKTMMKRFERLDINYAKSAFIVDSKAEPDAETKTVAVTLHTEFADSDIRYATNGSELNAASTKFTAPIIIDKTTSIKASLFENDEPVGNVFTDTITFHEAVSCKVEYKTAYHKRYQGAGAYNLVNTLRGTKNFRDGRWQAWRNEGAGVTIDLGEEKNISRVTIGSMVNQRNGIFLPTMINVSVSMDGETFTKAGAVATPHEETKGSALKDFVVDFEEQTVRYVKVEASFSEKKKEYWIFMDEIVVE